MEINPIKSRCFLKGAPLGAAGRVVAAVAAVALLLLAGCAHRKAVYYKPNAGKDAFERESTACRENAEKAARAQQVSPDKKPDPRQVQKFYEECLTASGWSKIPLDKRDRSLWRIAGNTLSFEKLTLALPPGFDLFDQTKFIVGPAWSDQYQAQNNDSGEFITLLAQESIGEPFLVVNYPVPEGFELYTGGTLDKYNIRWSVLTGYSMQKPVGLLTAYVNLNKMQRVAVIFTKSLSPTGIPTPGYPLSASQKKELESLYPRWLDWLKAQTGAKEERGYNIRKYFHITPAPSPEAL